MAEGDDQATGAKKRASAADGGDTASTREGEVCIGRMIPFAEKVQRCFRRVRIRTAEWLSITDKADSFAFRKTPLPVKRRILIASSTFGCAGSAAGCLPWNINRSRGADQKSQRRRLRSEDFSIYRRGLIQDAAVDRLHRRKPSRRSSATRFSPGGSPFLSLERCRVRERRRPTGIAKPCAEY